MKTIKFLLIFVIFLVVKAEYNMRIKRRQAFSEFGRMIHCVTGRSPFKYNGYGCWCGINGSGAAVDATDKCCKEHHSCYKSLVINGNCTNSALRWTSYERDGCSGCSSSNSGCGKGLCYCDQITAECFRWASYSTDYEDYDKSQC